MGQRNVTGSARRARTQMDISIKPLHRIGPTFQESFLAQLEGRQLIMKQ